VDWLPQWRTDAQLAGGGVILDHGWHQLYLLLGWMRQSIQSVKATIRTVDPRHAPVEDEASITLEFPSAEGRIELSWVRESRMNEGKIVGSRGKLDIHDDRLVTTHNGGRQEVLFRGKLTETSYEPSWFVGVLEDYVVNESPAKADRNFAEAGVLVSAIQAAYVSARNGGKPCRPTFSNIESVQRWMGEKVELTNGNRGSGAASA
jgi:predicted dehydrogenase